MSGALQTFAGTVIKSKGNSNVQFARRKKKRLPLRRCRHYGGRDGKRKAVVVDSEARAEYRADPFQRVSILPESAAARFV